MEWTLFTKSWLQVTRWRRARSRIICIPESDQIMDGQLA